MTATTATPVAKGIPGLVTPYSTSEFHAMVEAARAHHWAVQDQLTIVAAELYRGLTTNMQGRRGLVGVDVRMAARQVTRHLSKAANYEVAAAQAIVFSYNKFTQLFLGKPVGQQRGFDLDK